MFRVINDLAPMIDESSVSRQFGDPADAVRNAFKYVSRPIGGDDVQLNSAASSELKSVFGNGDSATTVEKTYFPVDVGIVRPAWRVLIWQRVNAYYVIIDAKI